MIFISYCPLAPELVFQRHYLEEWEQFLQASSLHSQTRPFPQPWLLCPLATIGPFAWGTHMPWSIHKEGHLWSILCGTRDQEKEKHYIKYKSTSEAFHSVLLLSFLVGFSFYPLMQHWVFDRSPLQMPCQKATVFHHLIKKKKNTNIKILFFHLKILRDPQTESTKWCVDEESRVLSGFPTKLLTQPLAWNISRKFNISFL